MTDKNPPEGMARAYLYNRKPWVWDGTDYAYDERHVPFSLRNLRYLLETKDATPIHLLNPANPQPWAIAPERDTLGFGSGPTTENWRLWVVTEKSSYGSCRIDLEDLASEGGVLAVYERRTIHGVDLLERVYLKSQPEQQVQGTASICRFIEDREPATPDDEPTELEDFELKILRECSGELPPSPWGAAVGQALETLRSRGLIRGHGLVTEKGQEYLKRAGEPPEKLGRWRHEPTGNTVDLDKGTFFSTSTGKTSRLVLLTAQDIVGQPDWTRLPDDEQSTGQPPMPRGQKDRAGGRPAPTCPECSNRGTTGMGPCSLCRPESERSPKHDPDSILRKCPNGRLSLRLGVLSPERDVALRQLNGAWCLAFFEGEVKICRALHNMCEAIRNHYPRTRHLRAVRAAFTEYVKSQEDVPTKPKDDAQGQENDQ